MRWIRSTKLYLIAGVVILTASLLGAHYIQNPNREPQRGTGQRNNAARGTNGQLPVGAAQHEEAALGAGDGDDFVQDAIQHFVQIKREIEGWAMRSKSASVSGEEVTRRL